MGYYGGSAGMYPAGAAVQPAPTAAATAGAVYAAAAAAAAAVNPAVAAGPSVHATTPHHATQPQHYAARPATPPQSHTTQVILCLNDVFFFVHSATKNWLIFKPFYCSTKLISLLLHNAIPTRWQYMVLTIKLQGISQIKD